MTDANVPAPPGIDELASWVDELGEARTHVLNAADRLAAYLASPVRAADHNQHVAMAGAGTILPHGILTDRELAALRQAANDLDTTIRRLNARIDRLAGTTKGDSPL